MNYSTNEINNLIKTLPIGYYIGRNLKITCEEGIETSLYNPMQDEIKISYNQIISAINAQKEVNDKDFDERVRSNLYHEVSHALLTPKSLTPTNVVNIFEDERIETILQDYYLNVDFKKDVKLMNNYHGEKPTNAESAFYHLVRYRVGEQKWLDEVKALISRWKNITRNFKEECIYDEEGYYKGYRDVDMYEHEVKNLYSRFTKEWSEKQEEENQKQENNTQENKEETQSSEENQKQETSQEQSNENESENSENQKQETSEEKEESSEETELQMNEASKNEDNEFTKEFARSLIDEVINTVANKDVINKVDEVLKQIKKSSKTNGSAINSYSGVFNPRSVARDDYKYFVQQNRLGHKKAFGKTHLNLFIDISGSFKSSETKTNQILFALSQFEKQNPDFDFDLITINTQIKLKNKNERSIYCCGGNRVNNEIWQIFKQVQKPQSNNYNIVLFDGDAFSDSYKEKEQHKKNMSVFNHSNTTIISNDDNQTVIERQCKNARKIFTNRNYTENLEKNILNTLATMAR